MTSTTLKKGTVRSSINSFHRCETKRNNQQNKGERLHTAVRAQQIIVLFVYMGKVLVDMISLILMQCVYSTRFQDEISGQKN